MIRRKKIWKYVGIFIALSVLIFVRDFNEPEDERQICGVSVDVGQTQKYSFGFEAAVPGNGKKVSSKVFCVEADDLREALEKADLKNSKPLRLNHGVLLIVSGEAAENMTDIAKLFLSQWSGQQNVYLAVAAEGRAADILAGEQSENLRSSQISEQIKAAEKSGQIKIADAPEFADRILIGKVLPLPLLVQYEEGYAITGTYYCNV